MTMTANAPVPLIAAKAAIQTVSAASGFPLSRERAGRASSRVAQFLRLIRLWRERARQRDALAQLDDRGLRDIGITRCDAKRECEKPFWR